MSKDIEQAVVHYEKDGITLYIEVEGNMITKEVDWSALGSVSFAKAESYANAILQTTNLGEYIYELLRTNTLNKTIKEHVWDSNDGKYQFVPMEQHRNKGFLGIDTNSKSFKYFEYGRLLAEFKPSAIGDLKTQYNPLYEQLRAQQPVS